MTLPKRSEHDPLYARIEGTAESVIRDLLGQAKEKGNEEDVAKHLVFASLIRQFPQNAALQAINKSNRKPRLADDTSLGDYVIESAVIKVAMGPPDEKHLEQIVEILEDSDLEIWLLSRADRVASWKTEVDTLSISAEQRRRVVIASVESFVGQNISELAGFSAKGKTEQFAELFEIYNSQWIAAVGTPGIRIEIP